MPCRRARLKRYRSRISFPCLWGTVAPSRTANNRARTLHVLPEESAQLLQHDVQRLRFDGAYLLENECGMCGE